MLPNKNNATKKLFLDFGLFWPFFNQKTAKIDKNEENWQFPNRSMKFYEIWYVDASQQKKCYKNLFFGFRPYLVFFLNQKTAKIDKNEENWENPNRMMKFSEFGM